MTDSPAEPSSLDDVSSARLLSPGEKRELTEEEKAAAEAKRREREGTLRLVTPAFFRLFVFFAFCFVFILV